MDILNVFLKCIFSNFMELKILHLYFCIVKFHITLQHLDIQQTYLVVQELFSDKDINI